MMRDTTIARTYAEALFEVAQADDEVERYGANLHQLAGLIESDRQFRLFLETPRIDTSSKKQSLREALKKKLPGRLLSFLLLVIDKRRQRLLPSIADSYAELVDEHLGRIQVRITAAQEPDRKLEAELSRKLGKLLAKKIIPIYQVDERIIGGVIIRVGDRIMDGSIRRRLQLLRRRLLRTELPLPE